MSQLTSFANKEFSGATSTLYTCKGAGEILSTPECREGYRLKSIDLSEIDERHLFDTEIHLKLYHHHSMKFLFDLLDFPAEVILHRVGILKIIIDTLGSVGNVLNDTSNTPLDAESILLWIERFSSKLLESCFKKCSLQTVSNCSQAMFLNEVPSVSGLIFACCATMIMLLRFHSSKLSAQILALLEMLLPFVLEHRLLKNSATEASYLNEFRNIFQQSLL